MWNEHHDRAAATGAHMTGPQQDYTTPEGRAYLEQVHALPPLDWADRDLAKITVFRLLSDPGLPSWDVSYVHGVDTQGRPRRVLVPFGPGDLPKRGMRRAIVRAAKQDGVYAKGLGLFGAISTLS